MLRSSIHSPISASRDTYATTNEPSGFGGHRTSPGNQSFSAKDQHFAVPTSNHDHDHANANANGNGNVAYLRRNFSYYEGSSHGAESLPPIATSDMSTDVDHEGGQDPQGGALHGGHGQADSSGGKDKEEEEEEEEEEENPWAAEAAATAAEAAAARVAADAATAPASQLPLSRSIPSPMPPRPTEQPPSGVQAFIQRESVGVSAPNPLRPMPPAREASSRGPPRVVPWGGITVDRSWTANINGSADDSEWEEADPDGCWAVVCPMLQCRGLVRCPDRTALCLRDICGISCARAVWCFMCCTCVPVRVLLPPRDLEYVSWERADEGSKAALCWQIAIAQGKAVSLDDEAGPSLEFEHGRTRQPASPMRRRLGKSESYDSDDESEIELGLADTPRSGSGSRSMYEYGTGRRFVGQECRNPLDLQASPQLQSEGKSQPLMAANRNERVRWAASDQNRGTVGRGRDEASPPPPPASPPPRSSAGHAPEQLSGGRDEDDASESEDVVLFRLPPVWSSDHSILLMCCCCCCVDYISDDCDVMGCDCGARPRQRGRMLSLPHSLLAARKDVAAAIFQSHLKGHGEPRSSPRTGVSVHTPAPAPAIRKHHGEHLEATGPEAESALPLPWENRDIEIGLKEVRATLTEEWGEREVTAVGSDTGVVAEDDGSVWVRRVVLPSGVLGDVSLDAYDYHLATSLGAAHVAVNLLAMLALMGTVALVVFPFVYART